MEASTFALLSLFGLPALMLALLLLAFKMTPAAIWRTLPVQVVSTVFLLCIIAAPILIALIDSQGDYYDDEYHLVGSSFGLPEGVDVSRQMDRTVRFGDCWRNAVNWRSEVEFASAASFDQWYAAEPYREGITKQIAEYFGTQPDLISIADGTFAMRDRDPRYVLSDENGSHQWNTRILEYYEPFVCAAIERDSSNGGISLRPCDPLARPDDMGSEGRVIVNPSARKRTLQGQILFLQGPSSCRNPVRRAINDALGLPHPESEPNLSMGSILPKF